MIIGPDLPQAVGVVDARRAGPGHLLGVDDVLGDRGVPAAPLAGQLMAAQRPSLSVRCHARRRSIARMIPPQPWLPDVSSVWASSSPTRRGTWAGARRASRAARSRNASSSARVGEVHRGANTHCPVPDAGVRSGRTDGVHLQRRPGRPAGDGAGVPGRARAPSAYVRAMLDDERGTSPTTSGTQLVELGWTGLLVPEEHGGLGPGAGRHGGRARGDGPGPVPRARSSPRRCSPRSPPRHLGLDDLLRSLAVGRDPRHRRARRGGPRRPGRPHPHPGQPQGRAVAPARR